MPSGARWLTCGVLPPFPAAARRLTGDVCVDLQELVDILAVLDGRSLCPAGHLFIPSMTFARCRPRTWASCSQTPVLLCQLPVALSDGFRRGRSPGGIAEPLNLGPDVGLDVESGPGDRRRAGD